MGMSSKTTPLTAADLQWCGFMLLWKQWVRHSATPAPNLLLAKGGGTASMTLQVGLHRAQTHVSPFPLSSEDANREPPRNWNQSCWNPYKWNKIIGINIKLNNKSGLAIEYPSMQKSDCCMTWNKPSGVIVGHICIDLLRWIFLSATATALATVIMAQLVHDCLNWWWFLTSIRKTRWLDLVWQMHVVPVYVTKEIEWSRGFALWNFLKLHFIILSYFIWLLRC